MDNNENQIFKFYGKKLVHKVKDISEKYIDNSYSEYLNRKSINKSSNEFVKSVFNYFSAAEYKDNLVLDLISTCDDFSKYFERFKIDFSLNNIEILSNDIKRNVIEERTLLENKKYLQIKVRRDELIDVILNGKPWEDLSIGFQCRIYRNPNIYNSKLWSYFTNNYISKNKKTLNKIK